MYAVIKTGGKQYVVKPGQVLKVEKINTQEGKSVEFEPLMVRSEEGVKLGDKAKSMKEVATDLRHGKGKKEIVYKYKAKTHYQRKKGHRQHFTEIRIEEITGGG